MNKSLSFARRIVSEINKRYLFLASDVYDFPSPLIKIKSLIPTGSQSVRDFVSSKLSSRIRSHLVWGSSCESCNVSYWKVV